MADSGNNTIRTYNATTGTIMNLNFITGLNNPLDVQVSGANLLVANFGSNLVGEYNATTGAVINSSFITGAIGPTSIAVAVPEAGDPSTAIAAGDLSPRPLPLEIPPHLLILSPLWCGHLGCPTPA